MPVELNRTSRSIARDRRNPVFGASYPARRTDREQAIGAVRELLAAVGADPDDPSLARTPQRVADAFLELFSGIGVDAASGIGTPVALNANDQPGELIALTGIQFCSMCEHHLLPFVGTVDVFYAPSRFIAGLSRIASVVEIAARRPQLQERLGMDIARAIVTALEPHGVVVRVRAAHGCVAHLEPRAASASAVTVAALGTMPEPAWRLMTGAEAT